MNPEPRRVLVIEDNPESRYLATLLLEGEGFSVDGVRDGAEGLARLGQARYAFVVLDLELPGLDGFEVAARIRRAHGAADLPIIAVSAMAMTTDRRKAFAAGCTGYLEKPIDADAFVAQLRCLADLPV